MDGLNRTVWQQACGDTDRNYADVCLNWGVILNGPGNPGPWPDCAQVLREDGWSARKITGLRRFTEEMKDGDLVVLRLGTGKVLGVGELVGEYQWHDAFGDIDGWDLQHVRRVNWFWKYGKEPKTFPTYELKLGDTTQKLNSNNVLEWIQTLENAEKTIKSNLRELPLSGSSVDTALTDVSEHLFDHGVASHSITTLLKEIGELIRIAKWYQRAKSMPSESETIAYLVVPLFRALGWSPQHMAVEWNRVDVALFNELPRDSQSLRAVVEVKKMDKSCLTAFDQALSYAIENKCLQIIVTDGLRYGVFVRRPTSTFRLYAYLNLTRLRNQYQIYDCHGALDALLSMAPESKPAELHEHPKKP